MCTFLIRHIYPNIICEGKDLGAAMVSCFMHCLSRHDDVIKWKHFPRYWPFARGIHRSSGKFPAQRPVTRSFDVFFDFRLNKRLSKQSLGWWSETPPRSLWRQCNGILCRFHCHLMEGTSTYLIVLHTYWRHRRLMDDALNWWCCIFTLRVPNASSSCQYTYIHSFRSGNLWKESTNTWP